MKKLLLLTLLVHIFFYGCGKKFEDSSSTPPTKKSSTVSKDDKERLFIAINSRYPSLVSASLNENPNIEYQFENGETPLTYAIKTLGGEKKEIVDILLSHTTNINFANSEGSSPLLTAIEVQNTNLFYKIMQLNPDINKPNKHYISPFIAAIQTNQVTIALELVASNANIELSYFHQQLLKHKLRLSNFKPLKKLLENIRSEVRRKQTLINHIDAGNKYFVKYLLVSNDKYKAINQNENLLNRALNISDKAVREYVLKLLLEFESDPNKEGINGLALSYAIEENQYDSVVILSTFKVDILLRDSHGRTPLEVAVSKLQSDVISHYENDIKKAIKKQDESTLETITRACEELLKLSHTSFFMKNEDEEAYLRIYEALDCSSN